MVCIDKTVLVFEDLSYGLQTQWEVSRFGRLCTRYVHTISCFRLLSTSSCVTSELLPRESDTPIDEDFSNSHEPTGGPDMHGHAGLPLPRREWGGLDREASEPPQVPSDINRTTVERNTQPDPPEPCEDREHDVGSNNTPSRLLPELQTSLRRHRNSSGTVKVDDSKYDSDFG